MLRAAMRRFLQVYVAMLKTGFASALAYRAEFFVWVLTTNMPLVNLALWYAVARDGPVRGFGQADFVAYFLATLIVRMLTGSWVVWEMTMDIRQGTMAMRLLRPVHPLLAYSAENLAAIPMRAFLALPIAGILLWSTGGEQLSGDWRVWALVPVMIAGAWVMTFVMMSLIGACAFFVDSAYSLWEVWFALFTVFSGYLLPLELFPDWLRDISFWLPFRYLLALPVEAMIGRLDLADCLIGLAVQAGWLVVLFAALRVTWSTGMRRFAAFGG